LYKHIFAKNVSRIMESRGITKKQLATLSGVSASFLSYLFGTSPVGQANLSLDTAEQIANALGVPLPYLLIDLDRPFGFDHVASYEHVSVVLRKEHISEVKKWAAEARKELIAAEQNNSHKPQKD